MKTLHLYLLRQVLISLVMTMAVFTFVLLIGNVLKDITVLLSRQVSLGLVLQAAGLLLPYVIVWVLPFAMLTAVLLAFGRFSADQELTAARAGGISLVALVTPILLLSLVLCGLSALFNLSIAPQCRSAYKKLLFRLETQTISSLITEDRFIDEIPGLILYIRKKSGDELEDVRLYSLKNNQIQVRTSARRGLILYDPAAHTIRFRLFDAVNEYREEPDPAELERFIGPPGLEAPAEWQPFQYGEFNSEPIDLSPMLRRERKPRLSEMDFAQLRRELALLESQGIGTIPVRLHLHRQVAFSFASFAFTLIGIPLAIRAHRRETTAGVAIALALVAVYFALFILGEALQSHERLHPHLLLWLPNLVFQATGVWLLARVNRI